MKVLVVRCDRLGDLVLSLPAMTWLRQQRPAWTIHGLVAAAAEPVVENDPALDAFYVWRGDEDPQLEASLRAERYDAAVVLQYQTPLVRFLRRCGVKRRIGPLSKWSSWWLLNRGIWQRRSRGQRHELDYNLDLVRRLAPGSDSTLPPKIHLRSEQREAGGRFRAEEAADAATVAFVHPGSGGSALNWEPERFAAVANTLAKRDGWRVMVTGSHHDRLVMKRVIPHLSPDVGMIAERFPLREFLGVLSAGDLIVAPSTGPLHLGAALGLAALGLYPPAPTLNPRRWGPVGTWSRSLVPEITCPARRNCRLEKCLLFNCMQALTEDEVVTAAANLIAIRRRDLTAGRRKEDESA